MDVIYAFDLGGVFTRFNIYFCIYFRITKSFVTVSTKTAISLKADMFTTPETFKMNVLLRLFNVESRYN